MKVIPQGLLEKSVKAFLVHCGITPEKTHDIRNLTLQAAEHEPRFKNAVHDFENKTHEEKKSIEATLNHLHIVDIQHCGCEDVSADKIVFIGRILKEIWAAKLLWQFPDRPCHVEYYEPEDKNNLAAYKVSFWQTKHKTE